jgi:UDP-GlcNAc:undecaprenyl-phosphate GlcNAc-1-phosphate transferase
VREYLVIFLVALVVTYLLVVLARELATLTGAVAEVRDRDVHSVPIPYFGGVAMLGGMVAAYLVARQLPFLSASDESVFRDARTVLIAGTLICAVGILDDIFELDALTKFGGQVLAAGFLILGGVQFYLIQLPGGDQLSLNSAQAAIASVFLVVTTVNAVNFVDGLDGLASGVIGIGAAAFFVLAAFVAVRSGDTIAVTPALLCAALAGACAGFLPHNFHPARIFMGDSGSMLIGLVLAGSALTLTGQFPSLSIEGELVGPGAQMLPALLPLIVPISILIVPFVDLVLAVVRRTRAGRSPFAPDKLHLHHRLLEIGHSHRRAVVIMWLWASLVAFGGVVASLFWSPLTIGALVGWFVVTVALTFVLPVISHPHLLSEE